MVGRGPNLNGGVIYTQFVCLKDATTCKNNFAGQVVKPLFYCCGIVSLHGAAAWRGGQRRTCEATINTPDANTPRCSNTKLHLADYLRCCGIGL
ncbi:hypothetical protein ACQJBY_001371 [Aegilops geniculata]